MTFYDYVMSFINEYDHVLNAEKTIIRYCFEIRKLADNLPIEFRNELNRDIDLLINDQSYLLELELKLHSEFSEIYKNRFSFILKVLSHYSDKKITRTSSFFIGDNEFRAIELYALNKCLTVELIDLLSKLYQKLSLKSQKAHFKSLRKIILDSNQLSVSKSLEELANRIESNIESTVKTRSIINKLRGEKVTIELSGSPHDITRYYKLNPIVLSQYQKIQKKITNKTEIRRFQRFTTALNNHCDRYPTDEALIKKHGLLALVVNDYEILIKLRSYLKTKIFKYVVYIVEILTGEEFNYAKHDNKCLYIPTKYGNMSTVRLNVLYAKSERFAKEFYNFFKKYIQDIKYHDANEVSLQSNISILRYIFNTFSTEKALDENGLNILSADNHSHFRVIKARINDLALEGKIQPVTQNGYYAVLKWFCIQTKQRYIKDYDQAASQSKFLASQDFLTRSYTQKELMIILNHVINAIKVNKDDYSRLMVAYFALIQITTGLNISTLCSLQDTEDHIHIDDNNENIFYFNFIKPRASHNTETHVYFKNTEDKILYLYLYVREKLRKQVIEKAINPAFKTDYFFVFLSKSGELQVANHTNIIKKVNELLAENGCHIRYNSKRIRKTVSNRVYKIVLKKFSVYRELVHHDFDVFVRHYEELNIAESIQKLAKGTKALQIFLKNREISLDTPEIKQTISETIEIEDSNIIQFTPLGNCSEEQNDNKPMCSDYLACVFCKNFSIVNSQAQIHKLLDFKNICISQMKEISSSYNSDSATGIAIKEFNSRVDYILNLLKQNDSDLYSLSVINYEPNQFFSL
ncbi:hypothetical protein [Acinetobacter sp. YH12049]|uniref:hypothetical protein n=1 Tax=Acinetobacter sp. YH12049 TaxID=2601054 RepID=UPI0015D0E8EC|nr:hypothetical protein [Acinetobacter sp. YH12049]